MKRRLTNADEEIAVNGLQTLLALLALLNVFLRQRIQKVFRNVRRRGAPEKNLTIPFVFGPIFQLPGQLHGRCQRRSYAWLPPQWPANHRAAKEVFRTHASHVQTGEETPSGLHAPDGGR